jgi:hypothetical protein
MKDKDENPTFRALIYMTFVIMAITTPFIALLNLVIGYDFGKANKVVLALSYILCSYLVSYLFFARNKSYEYYEDKYSERRISKVINRLFLLFFPVVFMFGGLYIVSLVSKSFF